MFLSSLQLSSLRRRLGVHLVILSLSARFAFPLDAQRVIRETTAQWNAVKRITLVKERAWCTDVDTPGCEFKGPATLRTLPDGGLLVADARGPLQHFSANGAFVGSLGRQGKGPGEYGFVIDAQLASNGLVTWFDNTQMRIATVSLDGKPGPVTRLMPPYTMANLMLVDTQLVILDIPVGAKLGDTVMASYRTVPASGTPTVLARVRAAAIFTAGSEGFIPMRSPFLPVAVGHVSARGDVAHSNGAQYDVEVFPRGAAAWRLRVEVPVRSVTSRDRDSTVNRVLKVFKAASESALPPNVRDSFAKMGSTFPPLADLRVLRDGTVWIRPTPPAGATSARWDVFSRDGQRVGQVLLPHTARVWDGERGWVLVSEQGEDEVQTFVRYGVRGG
ncbi:MAG: hypothetical protein KA154_04990 [Gemmatimonadaceae bacterium]|nr:hypothetical protein [Gemmatimonadaceae bacterium]MCC6432070.1 hypothetical protein [Gemmatimonadaceae bacterium]